MTSLPLCSFTAKLSLLSSFQRIRLSCITASPQAVHPSSPSRAPPHRRTPRRARSSIPLSPNLPLPRSPEALTMRDDRFLDVVGFDGVLFRGLIVSERSLGEEKVAGGGSARGEGEGGGREERRRGRVRKGRRAANEERRRREEARRRRGQGGLDSDNAPSTTSASPRTPTASCYSY